MAETFQERLEQVQARMAAACARAGRKPDEVQLIAVSKTYGPERVREATECGLRLFGENKVQEAEAKVPMCPGNISWHLVGHLQSNKAGRAVALFDQIHSVDSLKLLQRLEAAAAAEGKRLPVLLEINVSGEGSKFGLRPNAAPEVLQHAGALEYAQIAGLMTMPPFTPEAERARTHFRRLRELRDEWSAQFGVPLLELSMGMSHDFEVAIEEGATWIRVGTALFGERS
ncbi:MAG: YggS family pyridoxal phosphate-dependent enzyme [Verrucomicrobia bacterium]|nr:MAG: YggS family pyridoxal phosphate-dependent enzyme [Verrucomicrobiota bacterium]